MGFCQWAEMGPKVGFWVQKWVMGRNPLLTPRESGKSLEKVWKKSRKGPERLFRDFFQTLGGPGAGGPGRLFSDFFGVPGPEGPRDPCKWPTGSQG